MEFGQSCAKGLWKEEKLMNIKAIYERRGDWP